MRYTFFIIIIILTSCSQEQFSTPRPHQYPKISFPKTAYAPYVNPDCPFSMEIPAYATTSRKKLMFDAVEADPCWFDIILDDFNATIHCSYYPVGEKHPLDKLINDAFTMASKHNVKASFREEFIIKNENGSSGLIFKINGPVASPFQFYVTDSTNHFLRGSLYFDTKVVQDSVAPIVDYIEKDIDVLLRTLKWK